MAWRAANSLLVLHQQLKGGAPWAAPPATGADEWGLVGDLAHTSTSDHTPHNFAGWGSSIVTAADFPNRPDLGLDAHRVLDDIRRSRDPRAKYGISNGQIFSNHPVDEHGHHYEAWEWRPYLNADGSKPADGHYTHGHLSVVGTAVSDGEQLWQTIGGPSVAAGGEDDEDMGASFPPIEVRAYDPKSAHLSVTSLSIPPVQAGAADPRPVWLRWCNDTFNQRYALRVMCTKGDGVYSALKGQPEVIVSESGKVFGGVQLEAAVTGLSIMRWSVDDKGHAITPGTEGAHDPYDGHLTVCLERG